MGKCICNGSRGTDCDYCQGTGYIVTKEFLVKRQLVSVISAKKTVSTNAESDVLEKELKLSAIKIKRIKEEILEIRGKFGDNGKVFDDIEISVLKDSVSKLSSSIKEVLECHMTNRDRAIMHRISLEFVVLKNAIERLYYKPCSNKGPTSLGMQKRIVLSMGEALSILKKKYNAKK